LANITRSGLACAWRSRMPKKFARTIKRSGPCSFAYKCKHRNRLGVLKPLTGVRICRTGCTLFEALTALMSNVDAYATTLASLTGNAFQAEVCARLQSVVLGFQTIPSKPLGDAGHRRADRCRGRICAREGTKFLSLEARQKSTEVPAEDTPITPQS
jgi:hypothetical protein